MAGSSYASENQQLVGAAWAGAQPPGCRALGLSVSPEWDTVHQSPCWPAEGEGDDTQQCPPACVPLLPGPFILL